MPAARYDVGRGVAKKSSFVAMRASASASKPAHRSESVAMVAFRFAAQPAASSPAGPAMTRHNEPGRSVYFGRDNANQISFDNDACVWEALSVPFTH